jgi:hypothetical protein
VLLYLLVCVVSNINHIILLHVVVEESKSVQKSVDLSLGLSDVVDEDAASELIAQNKRKSTVNLSLGLGRVYSNDEEEAKAPGNPMLKIGLEVANDATDTNESKGVENLLSMSDMMSYLDNNSLGGEAWESKVDTK